MSMKLAELLEFSEIVDCRIGRFLAFKDDLITQQLVTYGAHTRNELALVLSHIKPGAVIVDIGSHIGTYCIPMARQAGTNGRVLAIEADPRTFELLNWNIGQNNLTSQVGAVCRVLGSHSLDPVARVDVAGNTGAGFYKPSEGDAAGEMAVDALSTLTEFGFTRPDLIKIDVEGMELEILRSLFPLLKRQCPVLYIEISEEQLGRFGAKIDDIDSLLSELEYSLYRNIGERNSSNDSYELQRLNRVRDGGQFFDLLAIKD